MFRSPGQPVPLVDFIGRLIGQPNSILTLAAFLMGLLSNILASLIGGWELLGISGNVWVAGLLAAAVILLYLYFRRRQPGIRIEMVECRPTGKAGLILLLSPLDPRARGTQEEIKRRMEEVQTAVGRISSLAESELTAADFAVFAETNWKPMLKAVEFHYNAGTLRTCWLIETEDVVEADGKVVKGSSGLGIVLERWFSYLYPQHEVDFVYGEEYRVKPRDYVRLWDTIDAIFRECPYKAEAVICDITGGLKLMSIGAALACLPAKRTMQYMATDRDWKGEPIPKGEIVPILVDIDPYLVWPGQA